MVGAYLGVDQPARLLWLLLLPLLYLLSRPPRPRRAVLTAHLQQWLRAQARLGRRPPRFRRSRFLLLVLAFLALVLAHAGSRVGGRDGAQELVILVDTSASLGARGEGGGGTAAWEELRRRLREQLANVPEHIPVRVGLCGAGLTLEAGRQAARGLDRVPRGSLAVDMAALAAQLQEQDPAGRVAVWSLTDGRGARAQIASGALTVVGTPGDNVGIVDVDVADAWPLPEVQVTATVANLGRQEATVQLAVVGGVEPVAARELRLPSRQQQMVALALRRGAGGRLGLELRGHRDALAADDRVAIQIPAPPAPEIAIYSDTPDNAMLQAAARALAAESGGRVVTGSATTAGFLLVDGGAMPRLQPGVRALTFGTWLLAAPASDEATVRSPRILDWDRQDPITKGLDLSGLRIDRCLRHGFSLGGQALLRGVQQDLIVVTETADAASVHAAFRLRDSNFALLAAFPQFLRRCYVRAYGRKAQAQVDADNLLDAAESDLLHGDRPAARPLPVFQVPALPLAVPLLLLALLVLVIRIYV